MCQLSSFPINMVVSALSHILIFLLVDLTSVYIYNIDKGLTNIIMYCCLLYMWTIDCFVLLLLKSTLVDPICLLRYIITFFSLIHYHNIRFCGSHFIHFLCSNDLIPNLFKILHHPLLCIGNLCCVLLNPLLLFFPLLPCPPPIL